ncbi:MAG: hypothetical protein KF755_14555, partial [Burkholderiaceae bacterium]|nr:hypothetical protein [Burkholderiaceae bacterium]
MTCLCPNGFSRLGASLILCLAFLGLCWPSAEASARESSTQAKRAAATKAKAKPDASVRRASAGKAPSVSAGKGVKRANYTISRKGVAVARSAKRSAASANVRPADPPRPSLGHAIG